MLVSSHNLDALLNTIYPISDDQAVAVQSFTSTGTFPSATVATVTLQVVRGAGLSLTGGTTVTVVAVTDSNNSIVVQVDFGGFTANFTEYVLGFSSNAILASLNTSNVIDTNLQIDVSSVNNNLGVLSNTPIASGQIVTFTANGSSSTPSSVPTPSDFNADGKSDLLLQNNNGDLVIWTQANLGITAGIDIGNPGPTWHAVAVADFNGDGKPDILLQNNSGAVVDYLMNGTTITAGYSLGNAGPSWHVRGAADFNNDGDADILLQNDNGAMVIWTTNGTSVTAGISLGNPGAGWTIEGVADFNGDGKPDILLQNNNGDIVDYLMNGTTITTGVDLGNPGAGWAVAGTGDYNGDGKADILLHNDNGADVVWDTNGTSVISAPLIGNPGSSYTGAIAGLDLNADGVSDLVIQNTDSTLIGYDLSSSGAVTAGADLGVPGLGWHAISNDPMEFIDGTHGNMNLVATPGPDQFDFTSFTGGLQQITGFDPFQDSMALSVATFPNYAGLQNNETLYQGGTLIALTPGTTGAAVLILGVTPSQLSAANFVLR